MYFVGLVSWASASRGRGAIAPWTFIHGTDKVEGGLMELFFGFVFPLPLWKFFCRHPWLCYHNR